MRSPETTGARRFLLVVPPFVGHVNPLAAVAARLRAAGCQLAWVGDPALLRNSPDRLFPCAPQLPTRPPRVRGFAALKHLWEQVLVPLADAMAPVVEQAVAEFAPDVVVADQQAFAGALVAERLGLPWVTSATTSSELTDPLADQPRVAQWQRDLLAGLRARTGAAADCPDPRFSPTLLLLYSTGQLTGPLPLGGASLACVGPALPVDAPPTPVDLQAPVLVTLGTTSSEASGRFLDVCEQALRSSRAGALLVDPTLARPVRSGAITRVPWIDQLDVLRRSSLVISHGGHNTVCESLWHGLPLVVAPIRDDQPIVADQVVAAGAGVRVRFDRVDAEQLAAAIAEVSASDAHRTAAARVGESFRRAGGAARAAELLLAL